MKVRILVLVFWGLVVGGIVICGCGGPEEAVEGTDSELPELVVDMNAPLLLDEPVLIDEPTESVGPEEAVEESKSDLPALVVDKNAPLLLDEPTESVNPVTESEAKNATCYVCHANYAEEELAQRHAKNDIGCAGCHGESIAHKNDENHQTAPDRMYEAGEIDAACGKCHTGHDVQPPEVIRRWKERIGDTTSKVICRNCHEKHDVPAEKVVHEWQEQSGHKIEEKPIVCTDCHGEHRLKMRSVQYD